jgi:hypothetical protein
MIQSSYTPENPPKLGKAKEIWDTFIANGWDIDELHYNKGPRSANGSGTWACNATKMEDNIYSEFGYHCGIEGKTLVYVQCMFAPYGRMIVGFTTRMCPFKYKHGCHYPSMYRGDGEIWPEGCPRECDCGSDEFLTKRNEEYKKFGGN